MQGSEYVTAKSGGGSAKGGAEGGRDRAGAAGQREEPQWSQKRLARESAMVSTVPTGSTSPREAVTKRVGRNRSLSQSNQRAESVDSLHHRHSGHCASLLLQSTTPPLGGHPQVPGTLARRLAAEVCTRRYS